MQNLQLNEINQALNIVNRRFGFDINWLMGLSLIQFHENLLKRKMSELGEKIQKYEKILLKVQGRLHLLFLTTFRILYVRYSRDNQPK